MKKELNKVIKQVQKDIKESTNLSWYVGKIRTNDAGQVLVRIKKYFITQHAIDDLNEVARKNNLFWYIEFDDIFEDGCQVVRFHE